MLFPVLVNLKYYVDAFNVALSSVGSDCIDVDHVYCWKHRIGAFGENAWDCVFHHDGVHLTDLGMIRYMNSVRTAVGQAVNKVRSQQ